MSESELAEGGGKSLESKEIAYTGVEANGRLFHADAGELKLLRELDWQRRHLDLMRAELRNGRLC